jgi:hypothetical protein
LFCGAGGRPSGVSGLKFPAVVCCHRCRNPKSVVVGASRERLVIASVDLQREMGV